jgi:FixJ family two-component response regulator
MRAAEASIGQYSAICHHPWSVFDEVSLVDERPYIVVVDDDESVRESLPDLLREYGYRADAFASAEEFLASNRASQTQCAIIDIAMAGMSGTDLQEELMRRGHAIPIVFITGNGDESVRLLVLERGAMACLFKPFKPEELLGSVKAALCTR